ncbi:hypothetical protein QBC46DRAFT_270825 [Diplogelasinospora grovesii]|uniref:Zn(2)-C6 fungal-type domain-containing protein n=1 Tax=Diplogelasinospora grovesii TaxID=303347 RepID=A0AAN6MZ81_9PEZI|nr:hypothetical protein QBC46DRAFT_270825 [Diplogelasinospora grovesii]
MSIATHYNYPASSIGASSTTRTSPTAVSPSSTSPGSNAMSLDQRPYAELDRPYVKVVKDEDEKRPGDLEFSDQSDCDEQEVVPAATPLNGSFVDLTQELKDTYGGDVPSAEATSPSSDAASDRKRRARFGEDQRKETSETRNLGACMRCHNQRIRCVPNPLYPDQPCQTCVNVSMTNKKTIHNFPCLRDKVTSMTIYRAGNLRLTRRFSHTQVMDVGDNADNVIRTVVMSQGLSKKPIILQVRRFIPREGDVLNRRYIDNGVPKEERIAPFCLADVEKTAKGFQHYIRENALDGLAEAAKGSDDLVQFTFAMIGQQCRRLFEMKDTSKKKNKEWDFLHQTVRLWFATRHGIGSAWLMGEDTLGMELDEPKPNHPLDGRVSVPRMVVAQFDSIRHERIYKELAPKVLRLFQSFLGSGNLEAWFTVYLAAFLLLHQAACTSYDRRRYVKQNSGGMPQETRYGPRDHPLTKFVEEVQSSAGILLAHWLYYRRVDVMSLDWKKQDKSSLKHLEPYQAQFMKSTVDHLKRKMEAIPKEPRAGCWEDELCWIARMFDTVGLEEKWSPPESFTTAKPSVGRDW